MEAEQIPPAKRREDAPVDMEQQFIMRLPACPAAALRHDVEQGALSLKEKLSIELQQDMRHCMIRYGGQVYKGKFKDLPCIVESLKTIDKKTLYKTADISQILLCKETFSSSDEEDDVMKKREPEKRHKYPHGVTPPLKNVRKRRFRKTLKKKYPDQPEIEKEVKRLFAQDAESIDVRWEVVIEEKDKKDDKVKEEKVLYQGEASIEEEFKEEENQLRAQNILGLAARDVFGDDLSSSDDEDKTEQSMRSFLLGDDSQYETLGSDYNVDGLIAEDGSVRLDEVNTGIEFLPDPRRMQMSMESSMNSTTGTPGRLHQNIGALALEPEKVEHEDLSGFVG